MTIMLSSLLKEILSTLPEAVADLEVSDLYLDSRQVQPGSLFVALAGGQSDGRRFIHAACRQGASAVLRQAESVSEHGQVNWLDSVPVISCWALPDLLEQLATRTYPRSELPPMVVGVTGTNGKSTTTHLIASLAEQLGVHSAVMGTLGNGRPNALEVSANTTADIFTIYRQLAGYSRQGVQLVAMEVSSHGLVQKRVAGVPFTAAVFTNLTRDHLDYHGSMEAYGEAKSQLFSWPSLKHRIINCDDPFGVELLQQFQSAVSCSSRSPQAKWYIEPEALTSAGCQAKLFHAGETWTLNSPLLGRFNLDNLLCSLATLVELGFDVLALIKAAERVVAVPGRMEVFGCGPALVVDYAHTPDALAKALEASREHCNGRLICIFGCGGDRDQGKRPLMAKFAELHSDRIIVTDDNPRHEDPKIIINDILEGFIEPEQVLVIHSRQAAIERAIAEAGVSDMILIAGKGHEDYQLIGDKRIDYNERRLVAKLAGDLPC